MRTARRSEPSDTGPLVIVGDTLLDVDVEGRADRLCPEAPVPVVDVGDEWLRPGGAGLAAALATRSTPDVVLITAIGDDDAGDRLSRLLADTAEMVSVPLRGSTVCKCRVRAGGQSLLRMDSGDGRAEHAPLDDRVHRTLDAAGAVLVSDYGRGITANQALRAHLTELARRVPVVWDPHPSGSSPVDRARLVTPNESEAWRLCDHAGDVARYDTAGAPGGSVSIRHIAPLLRHAWRCDGVAVTLGARGALLAANGSSRTIPVSPGAADRAAGAHADTCGAGDRFASAAAAELLSGADTDAAVATAVDSAARFVAAGGATGLSLKAAHRAASVPADPAAPADLVASTASAPADPAASAFDVAERVRRNGGTLVAAGGCFDLLHPGHARLLERARELGDALVVCLNSDRSVRRLKGPGRPIMAERDRARLLLAMSAVDAVAIFDEPTPVSVLDRFRPDVWVKGGDYDPDTLPEADVVRGNGGRIEVLPLLGDYSTTKLAATAAGTRQPREAT
ncbi:MAG: adenylyltransferase/cytidyltransferase family protein [Actinophytocola sp.]|nr:adenylyltransferase/cytidyltransferase family protein [Actinophytocola sp.]